MLNQIGNRDYALEYIFYALSLNKLLLLNNFNLWLAKVLRKRQLRVINTSVQRRPNTRSSNVESNQ